MNRHVSDRLRQQRRNRGAGVQEQAVVEPLARAPEMRAQCRLDRALRFIVPHRPKYREEECDVQSSPIRADGVAARTDMCLGGVDTIPLHDRSMLGLHAAS